MVVSTSTFLSDSTLFIRDLLLSNVTDPISSRGTNSKFVLTAYPERPVSHYPIITVKSSNITMERSGMRSEDMSAKLNFEIRVWARNVKERDTMTQNVIDILRSKQLDTSTGSIDSGLFGLSINSAVDVDEEGENGLHSKILEITYNAYLDSA